MEQKLIGVFSERVPVHLLVFFCLNLFSLRAFSFRAFFMEKYSFEMTLGNRQVSD